MRTVFAFNCFYQGVRSLGNTSSWELTWKSFLERVAIQDLYFFNPDVFGTQTSQASDSALQKLVSEKDIELLVMIYHNGIGWQREFIGDKTLQWLRERNVRVVAIWGDIQIPAQQRLIYRLSQYVDLNIMTASHGVFSRFRSNVKRYYSWVPIGFQKSNLDDCTCGALISFGGSLKDGRKNYIDAVISSGLNVHIGGGEGTGSLPRDEYLRILAHPISISFSGSSFEPLVNARTFEIVSQGGLLLEQWGRETPKFLIPFEDYVPWFNKNDLVEKAHYYSSNPALGSKIAQNGQRKFLSLSDEKLWQVIVGGFGFEAENEMGSFVRANYTKEIAFSRRIRFLFRLGDSLTRNRRLALIYTWAFYSKIILNKFYQYRAIAIRKIQRIFIDQGMIRR